METQMEQPTQTAKRPEFEFTLGRGYMISDGTPGWDQIKWHYNGNHRYPDKYGLIHHFIAETVPRKRITERGVYDNDMVLFDGELIAVRPGAVLPRKETKNKEGSRHEFGILAMELKRMERKAMEAVA